MHFDNLIDILPQCHMITPLSSPNGTIMFFPCKLWVREPLAVGFGRPYDKAGMNDDIVEYTLKIQRNNNTETSKMTNYRALGRSSR